MLTAALQEELFVPTPQTSGTLARVVGMLGSAALGAAVYGALKTDYGSAVLAPLAFGGVGGLIFGLRGPAPGVSVRVGPLGVAVDAGDGLRRAGWWQIKGLSVVGEELRLAAEAGTLSIPLLSQRRAAARIWAEAKRRIGDLVELPDEPPSPLRDGGAAPGQLVNVLRAQLVGQRCLASGERISLERDAAPCSNCAAPYHRRQSPERCLHCGRPTLAAEADPAPPQRAARQAAAREPSVNASE